jgi:hypothetical protein
MRAVVQHGRAWFGQYIFGDPKPDLAAPPVPAKTDEEKKKGSDG